MESETQRLYELGLRFMDRKLYDNSLFYFNKALGIEPREPELWLEKGRALASMNEFTRAIQCFDNVISMKPGAERAWISKGLAYHCMGDFEAAIACFDRAISITGGENYEAWYAKGVVLFLMHDFDVAMEHFERTLDLNPLHQNAAIFLRDSKKRLAAGEDVDDIFDIEEGEGGKTEKKKSGPRIVSSRKAK